MQKIDLEIEYLTIRFGCQTCMNTKNVPLDEFIREHGSDIYPRCADCKTDMVADGAYINPCADDVVYSPDDCDQY